VGGTSYPKAYTGTYGYNGFHLDFADNSPASALGTDVSGNNNNFSVTSIETSDQLTDVPSSYTAPTRPTRRWGGITGRSLVENTVDIEYLIVGGGGAGRGGGGGAGGLLAGTTEYSAPTSFTVAVGAGGVGANGGDSSALGLTAIGGGVGGEAATDNAASGGSGGGGGHDMPAVTRRLGTSGQGNQGGRSNRSAYGAGGGGGGAGGAGGDATAQTSEIGRGGDGGVGVQNSITGSAVFYAGGGGGGVNTNSTAATAGGNGGAGGGGDGGLSANSGGNNGTDGLGGGGGGADYETDHLGGNGGSGVVILRYPSSTTLSIPAGLTYTHDDTTVAGFTITKFSGGTGTVEVTAPDTLPTTGVLTLAEHYQSKL